MTSPPLTTREYAYFHITGPSTHEDVTVLLGVKPSEAWNAGDVNLRTCKPRKLMSWRLRSSLDDTRPLAEHIAQILEGLYPRVDALRRLWVEHDLTLQCVGYYPSSGHGMHFDREQIRKAAMLGLALDLDFYFIDDHAHEI
ncbi:hypothetical protein SDC9_105002 [bioreactor metagenome]|uniref:DUF4279 domain-containing protein n=1 Tax=bioreactor metagenome TaxID=1076179 RepID=A0A645B4U5_9ZZZZ